MKNIKSFQNDELGPLLEYPKTNNKAEPNIPFKLVSDFSPAGDQPQAIRELVEGVNKGERSQILLGVTGSGKTFTMAQIIEKNPKISNMQTMGICLWFCSAAAAVKPVVLRCWLLWKVGSKKMYFGFNIFLKISSENH